jgi:hypothetical protein
MPSPEPEIQANFSTRVVATLQSIRAQANSIESDIDSNYLTKASASATYLTQNSASAIYLDQSSASAIYAPINSPSFSGEVSFVSASVTGIDLLPSQSGNTGKFLSTDGTNALWETLSLNFDNDQNIIAMQVFR